MRLLLDTAAFLWACLDSPQLSKQARRSFISPDNELYLSSVSTWEIATTTSNADSWDTIDNPKPAKSECSEMNAHFVLERRWQ